MAFTRARLAGFPQSGPINRNSRDQLASELGHDALNCRRPLDRCRASLIKQPLAWDPAARPHRVRDNKPTWPMALR